MGVRPPREEVVADGDFLLTVKKVAQPVQNDRRVLPLREVRLLRLLNKLSENLELPLDNGDALLALLGGVEVLLVLTDERLPICSSAICEVSLSKSTPQSNVSQWVETTLNDFCPPSVASSTTVTSSVLPPKSMTIIR